jgi:NAD(P)-dependent dehydrogenase (short-subunit alcohol dehydrogenase family)
MPATRQSMRALFDSVEAIFGSVDVLVTRPALVPWEAIAWADGAPLGRWDRWRGVFASRLGQRSDHPRFRGGGFVEPAATAGILLKTIAHTCVAWLKLY